MIAELRTDTELERQIAADWLCEYGTEADWNRLLDQYHSDQELRRRFGEWLLERGEAKGEGYLALSACGRDCMTSIAQDEDEFCPYWFCGDFVGPYTYRMPADWAGKLEVEGSKWGNYPLWELRTDATREELEEAAALAFLLLPESRRAELLAGKL